MKKTYRIAVIGGGSWGTAIAHLLASNGHDTTLWVRNRELLKVLKEKRENILYLKGIRLNSRITFSNDIESSMENRDIVAFAVPVSFLRGILRGIKRKPEGVVVSLSKGIEIETFLTPSEIIKESLGVDECNLTALSGPNFAKEVAQLLPTATVVASKNKDSAKTIQDAFSSSTFRVYTTDDVKGVELCGAMKNIVAIASGISDGLKLGLNARASLITRGLAEIVRLGKRFGAKSETFMGLAGVGDLILTCTGNLSRNRSVGLRLAQGEAIETILKSSKMVPEGVSTVRAVYEYSKKISVELPITQEVYKIIYEGKSAKEAVKSLMNRPLKEEYYLL